MPGIELKNMHFKASWQFSCVDRYGNQPMKHTSFLPLPWELLYSLESAGKQAFPTPGVVDSSNLAELPFMHSPDQKNTILQ